MAKRRKFSPESANNLLDWAASRGMHSILPAHSSESLRLRAAQYLRMSSENQVYSLVNQKAAIQEYAENSRIDIVRTYSDSAKCGVVLKGRHGLKQLLQDALSGDCPYDIILVFDVSRWGRFQDQDEAACYEFLCRSAGLQVHYCAEPFTNDGSVSSSILKNLKRTMAAEYSRELGSRIFDAKARLVRLGYWVGGPAPFGMCRVLLSENSKRKRVLKHGECKNLRTDREILGLGPKEEVEAVQTMFALASKGGMGCHRIALELNRKGVTNRGRKWHKVAVLKILRSPVYTGRNVWNRTSQKLQGERRTVPFGAWIQKSKSFPALISQRCFEAANEAIVRRRDGRKWTNSEILARLRWLLRRKGSLSHESIERTDGMPCSNVIRQRFGSLFQAYDLIGYQNRKDYVSRGEVLKETLRVREELIRDILNKFPEESLCRLPRLPVLCLDSKLRIAILVCRSLSTQKGRNLWPAVLPKSARECLVLLCMLDAANDGSRRRLFLFSRIDLQKYHRFYENDPLFKKGREIAFLSDLCETARSFKGLESPLLGLDYRAVENYRKA